MQITDDEWDVVVPLIPKRTSREDGKGRPRVDDRGALNGILYAITKGLAWRSIPKEYPSPATCHRRYQEWKEEGVLEDVVQQLSQKSERFDPSLGQRIFGRRKRSKNKE